LRQAAGARQGLLRQAAQEPGVPEPFCKGFHPPIGLKMTITLVFVE
jgi:hypothetical protein